MSSYSDYLSGAAELLLRQAQALKADGREDEANLCRIRSNIFSVCHTVLNTFAGRYDANRANAAYLNKLSEFDAAWRAAMEQAAASGDHEKAAVEENKLAALREIIAHYGELE